MTLAVGIDGRFEAQRSGTSAPSGAVMVGNSAPIRRLRELIERVARTRLPVLIQGPTGSGKELVAAALHSESGRAGLLVPFNVCAISESMFEDALFGHARGAFTGAMNEAPGYLREAHGGTVFLDEVSGLPLTAQAKLLRAVETGVFRPVGAKRDSHCDFRVVAATNEDLDTLVAEGRFRADLAYRLAAVVLVVPPLVDRLEDLRSLTEHFLGRIGAPARVTEDGYQALASHDWPGNVRELKHVVECALAFSDGNLRADAIRAALAQRRSTVRVGADLLHERRELAALLESCGWDADAAARQLGVHRATLYRRMRRLGVALRS